MFPYRIILCMKLNLVPAPNGFMCLDDPGEPGKGGHRWSVSNMEARVLATLFRDMEVLEIGTGLGVSTNSIAKTAKIVYTVDYDPWVERAVVPTLALNVIFFTDIEKVKKGLDGAFIDGDHHYEPCKRDIEKAREIVKPGGIIVFHDAGFSGVVNAVEESGLPKVLILTEAGLVLTWNEGE